MKTEAHHLTREEGGGYCTALTDLHAWHSAQAAHFRAQAEELSQGVSGSNQVNMIAVALAKRSIEAHEAAIAEIERLHALQTERTFGRVIAVRAR